MFESAELGHHVDDARYKKQVRKLRGALLDAQYDLLERKSFSLVVIVSGIDGAGRGEAVNLLNEWMDPRHVKTHAFGAPTTEQAERPPMWRYWQALPPAGEIAVLFGGWYGDAITRAATGEWKNGELNTAVEHVRQLERLLANENVLVLKVWFHLSKKAQKKRFESLEANKVTRWRVTKEDWKNQENHERIAEVAERVLRDTSTGEAPWIVIDGSDGNYAALTFGQTVLAALRGRLDAEVPSKGKKPTTAGKASPAPLLQTVDTSRILTDLKFEERLSKEKYETKLEVAQGKLNKLSRSPRMKRHAVVCVFEGMDAAGKGGAIRRVTRALDARAYTVIPIAAPSPEEAGHPYLWRFWRHVPRRGRFVLYDRSWYGRVLVERVEGFAPEVAWHRAYSEINDFEEQLVESGIVVVKFWLAVSKEEQLVRFKKRQATAFKQYKITPDDWRNRGKWNDYIKAAGDMIDRTSTSTAPWTVVEANDKHLARVRVIETIARRLKERLG